MPTISPFGLDGKANLSHLELSSDSFELSSISHIWYLFWRFLIWFLWAVLLISLLKIIHKWDILLWEGCHQVQHMHHNANNLPLWTWWQQHQITLPLWHQGQRVDQDILFLCWIIPLSILPLSTCWNLWIISPFVYAKVYQSVNAPPEYMPSLCTAEVCCSCSSCLWARSAKDVLQEEHDSIHHKRPSYHQRLIHTSISQLSEDIQKLTHPPNQVGIHQKFTYDNQSSQA